VVMALDHDSAHPCLRRLLRRFHRIKPPGKE
jgi:hypothetical protein